MKSAVLNGQPIPIGGRMPVNYGGALPYSRYTRSPLVSANGNPYASPGSVLYLPGFPGSGSSITDFSGQGNNGTITGATWNQLSSGLPYLDFDGDDNVDCGDPASLQFTTAFTLKGWFNATSFPISTIHLMGKDDNTNRNYALGRAGIAANQPLCTVWISNVAKSMVGDSVMSANTWYQIIGVFNSATVSVYLNGVLDATPLAAVGSVDNDAVNFTIGERPVTNDRDFLGGAALMEAIPTAWTAAQCLGSFKQEKDWFGR